MAGIVMKRASSIGRKLNKFNLINRKFSDLEFLLNKVLKKESVNEPDFLKNVSSFGFLNDDKSQKEIEDTPQEYHSLFSNKSSMNKNIKDESFSRPYDLLWNLPIDNEQVDNKDNSSFDEHVFFSYDPKKFPNKKEIRTYMNLVVTGLRKNPHMSIEEKKEIISFYENYFKKFKIL